METPSFFSTVLRLAPSLPKSTAAMELLSKVISLFIVSLASKRISPFLSAFLSPGRRERDLLEPKRVYVGKEIIPFHYDFKKIPLPFVESGSAHLFIRQFREFFEVFIMARNPCLGVIRRRAGGNQKLPIRGLKQEKHASRLFNDVRKLKVVFSLGVSSREFLHLIFRLVNLLPRPLVHVVKPYPVIPAHSPTPLRKAYAVARTVPVEMLARGYGLDS